VRAFLRRLLGTLGSRDAAANADAEFREEIEAHLEMEAAEFRRRGMDPVAAGRAARAAAGGITQAIEAMRAQRKLAWLGDLGADLRYALRSLHLSPLYATLVVTTLALALGANAAMFSAVRGVILRPLPHHEGNRLVYLRHRTDDAEAGVQFSVPEIREFRESLSSFSGIAEYSPWSHTLHGPRGATRLDVALVGADYFNVMGLRATLGRLIRATDDRPDALPVIVLSHELWRSTFAADSSILGRALRLDGTEATVVGVLEPAPSHPTSPAAYLNLVISPHHLSAAMVEARAHRMSEAIARLAPNVDLATAASELEVAFSATRLAHPREYDPSLHHRVELVPLQRVIAERARPTVLWLFAAAAFVLAVAFANVANLSLMRRVDRERELVLRISLGAGTGRVRRLLLAEHLLLAFAGVVTAIPVAFVTMPVLTAVAQRLTSRASEIRIDGGVFAALAFAAFFIALALTFVVPMPREEGATDRFGDGGRPPVPVRTRSLRRILVVAQVAFAVILLAGAGLLTRTLLTLRAVDAGLRTEQLLTLSVPLLDPARATFATDLANKATYAQIAAEARSLPGVVTVGLGSTVPLRSSGVVLALRSDEPRTPGEEPRTLQVENRTADPGYFAAAGIPLLQGRYFTRDDASAAPRVVIVNRTLAAWLAPNGEVLGRRVAFTGELLRFTPISDEWRTVVGIVGDTRDGGLAAQPRAAVFLPFAQQFAMTGAVVVRIDGDAEAVATGLERIVRRLAPTAPLSGALTIEQILERELSPRRVTALLAAAFGLLAALVAAIGIGGTLSYAVRSRRTEIAIRLCLGADAQRVERMFLREGLRDVLAGAALGLFVSFASAGVLRTLLYGIEPRDPVTLVGAALAMSLLGVLACWLPARRACRVNPASAIRSAS
jgi:putative ABC transport system permease protein